MFKKKAQETGRSMVEMLGVLAIIGVLSVAGIAGYRYAMNRYIANDVLHESNIRGFDVTANFKGRRLPDIAEIGGYAKYTGTGKPIGVYPNPEDFSWSEYADKCPSEDLCQAFDVEVKGLNKRQCQMIMQSSWELPDAYLVSTGIAGDTSGDGTAPIIKQTDNANCTETWSNGTCVCNDQSYADGDRCTQCPSGSTPTSDGCICSGTNTHWNGSSCITCDTNATFKDNGCVCNSGYYGNGTNCTVCERPRRTNASNTTCDCPSGTIWSGAETNLCEEADDGGNGGSGGTGLCDAGMIWNSALGECAESNCSNTADCPYGYVCDITDGQCIKDWECENPHALDVTQTKCVECTNWTWSDVGKCAACPSNQIRLESGLCGCPLDMPYLKARRV